MSPADLAREAKDRDKGPALSSAIGDPDPWESYNQWMCFDVEAIEVSSEDIDIGSGWQPWPQLEVRAAGQRFYFEPETDLKIDTREVIGAWSGLIRDSRQVCLYAAFLQYLDPAEDGSPQGLWVLEGLKTSRAYWNVEEAVQRDRGSQDSEHDGEVE